MPDHQLLIETAWETRNLGRRSFELSPAALADPTWAGVDGAIEAVARESGPVFVHARVDREQLDRIPDLQAMGFYVVECSVEPFLVLGKSVALARFADTPSAFFPARFRMRDLRFTAIARGNKIVEDSVRAIAAESFVDDRFHLDHQCPVGVAGRRYRYWVDDLLADAGVSFHCLVLDGTPVGFFAHRDDHLILSGFTRAHAGSGLGAYFWFSVCRVAQAAGHAVARSRVSCNNLPSLNLFSRMGFKFRATAYSLHCWR
jgi:hypothetical protein